MTIYIVPILHPSFIVRGGWKYEPAQIEFCRLAKSIASGFEPAYTAEDVTKMAPLSEVATSPSQVEEYFERTREEGYAVDVECAGEHLVYLGFCSLSTYRGLGIQFRGPKGVPWWRNVSDLKAIVEHTFDVFKDPGVPIVFHNGNVFDIPVVLEPLGFEVNGFVDDTLLMAHTTYEELPKGLEFLSTFHLGVPMWKWLVSEKELGEEK